MKVRRLDSNHDWTFGDGSSNYAADSEATLQCVETILLSFLKNWFLGEDHGIDWWAYFSKNPDVVAMENDIKRHILAVEGVDTLEDLTLQLDTITRKMTINVRYIDIYGKTNTVVQNVGNY